MAFSRRQFITTAGSAASGALVHSSAAAAPPPAALTLACSNYVRFMPIATGDVRPRDLALTWLRGDRTDMLRRATDDATIDGGESSMAQHVMRLDRGDRSLRGNPGVSVAQFHSPRSVYAQRIDAHRADAWRTPAWHLQLGGQRCAVWYRHLMRYLGHDTTKIAWVVGGADAPADVRLPEPSSARGAAPKGLVVERPAACRIDRRVLRSPAAAASSIRLMAPSFECSRASGRWSRSTSPGPAATHRSTCCSSAWLMGARPVGRSAARRRAFNESETSFEAGQRQFLQFAVADRGRRRRGAADGRRLPRARAREESPRGRRLLPLRVRGRPHQATPDG